MRVLLLSGLLAAAFVQPAFAQAYRPPTPVEKTVIDRYAQSLDTAVDSLADDNWQEDTTQHYDVDADVAVNTANREIPLAFDATISRLYEVRQGSDRFNTVVAPMQTQLEALSAQLQATDDPQQRARLIQQMSDLTDKNPARANLYIDSEYNFTNYGPDDGMTKPLPYSLPGVAAVFAADATHVDNGKAYVLIFGDWSRVSWDAGHNWYHYRFNNPPGTPHVENFMLRIEGPEDYVQALLSRTDWTRFDAALTP